MIAGRFVFDAVTLRTLKKGDAEKGIILARRLSVPNEKDVRLKRYILYRVFGVYVLLMLGHTVFSI